MSQVHYKQYCRKDSGNETMIPNFSVYGLFEELLFSSLLEKSRL